MFVQALKHVGMAFRAARAEPQAMAKAFFEVQLVGEAGGCLGAVPLTITTDRPFEVAGELMRDRDPRQWDVEIRPVPHPRRTSVMAGYAS